MKTKRKRTTSTTLPGGTFKLADDLVLTRMGYGAMQLAGPHVFGPPADDDGALAVLREVVSLGITHIDTSDFYGLHQAAHQRGAASLSGAVAGCDQGRGVARCGRKLAQSARSRRTPPS